MDLVFKVDILRTISFTHTDLDGVASSATFLRANEIKDYKVVFTEPDSLHISLRNFSEEIENYEIVSITDLGPNPGSINLALKTLSRALNKGIRVIWIDHHIWNDNWAKEASSRGIELRVDTSTCATGLASRFKQKDSYLKELSEAVCSADEWRFDNEKAPWLVRFVGFTRNPIWLKKAHEAFMKANTIEELLEVARPKSIEVHETELKYSNEFLKEVVTETKGSVKVAFGIKKEPEVSASLLSQLMLARFKADIAAILNEEKKLEFRSNKCNVREIAFRLGGGGHPKASGAPLPPRIRFLISFLPNKAKISLVLHLILKAIEETGCILI